MTYKGQYTPRIAWTITAIVILIVIGICLLSYQFAKDVLGMRIVAEATAPDGTQLLILQKFNWSGEPFTTSVYTRRPGEEWGWFYYDHQDWYWGQGTAKWNGDTDAIEVYREGTISIRFKPASYQFQRLAGGTVYREFIGPQDYQNPPIIPQEDN